MNRRSVICLLLVGLSVGSWSAPELRAGSARLEITATLSGTGKGKARYREDGVKRALKVEVQNLTRFAGQSLTVTVNNGFVGRIVVNALGNGTLELETQRGQAVPKIVRGNVVKVSNAAGVLQSGTF